MPSLRPALDRSYHYPPDVLELLVDTIPRLIKTKAGLLDFFEQAGTPEELIAEWRTKLRQDRMSVSKYHIARGVLRGLNALGDEARPVRHQVLSHLARQADFSAGWEDDRERAEELVARIRELAGETDAGTWQAACQEALTRQATLETYHARLKHAEDRREALAALKRDLYQAFRVSDPAERRPSSARYSLGFSPVMASRSGRRRPRRQRATRPCSSTSTAHGTWSNSAGRTGRSTSGSSPPTWSRSTAAPISAGS